jgi:hypothetical protein
MTHTTQTLKDDLAFIRSLAEEGRAGPLLGGPILLTNGLIFSGASLLDFALATHPALARQDWLADVWWAALGLSALVTIALIARLRAGKGRGSGPLVAKTFGSIWSGVGLAVWACVFGLLLAQARLQDGTVFAGFPTVILALYGAGWTASATLAQQRWMWGVALGGFAAAVLAGWLAGQASLLLVFAAALLLLMAAPGLILMRQARGKA